MQPVVPDILTIARGLSPAIPYGAIALGAVLWVTGWWWHRFWLVAALSVAGGLFGLMQAGGTQAILVGVLVAVASGLLAIELARIFAFLAAGTAVWSAAGMMMPKAQELWVAFLLGGVAGLLLYRLWTMALTSFIGSTLVVYGVLISADAVRQVDGPTWAGQNSLSLTIGIGIATALGTAVQGAIHRVRRRRAERWEEETQGMMGRELQALRNVLTKAPTA